MEIKVIDNGNHRMIAVDVPYFILKNGEYFGQRAYVADTVAQINTDIANGVYTVAVEDGDSNG